MPQSGCRYLLSSQDPPGLRDGSCLVQNTEMAGVEGAAWG